MYMYMNLHYAFHRLNHTLRLFTARIHLHCATKALLICLLNNLGAYRVLVMQAAAALQVYACQGVVATHSVHGIIALHYWDFAYMAQYMHLMLHSWELCCAHLLRT